MTEKRGRRCEKMEGSSEERQNDPSGNCGFAGVEQQGEGGNAFISGTEDIGCTDIPGPDLPDIGTPCCPR